MPLTPRHTAGLVAAWEQEGRGRIGAEFYYTGPLEARAFNGGVRWEF